MFEAFLLPLQNVFNRKNACARAASKSRKRVRYWTNLSLFGIATYVLISMLAVSPLYRFFLFVPLPAGEEYRFKQLEGIPKEDIYVKTDGGPTLHGWFFQNKGGQGPVILVSHGSMGNISSRVNLAKALLSTGSSVLLYDYEGYGLSSGQPSLQALCIDGTKFYDYLVQEKKYDPSRIVLYGESLGCAASCKIAAARKCAGMILQSGFSSLVAVARGMYPLLNFWPESAFPQPAMSNSEMLSAPHPPLLIMHGKFDALVPLCHAERNYAAAANPKELILFERSGHIDLVEGEKAKFVSVVQKFMGKYALLNSANNCNTSTKMVGAMVK